MVKLLASAKMGKLGSPEQSPETPSQGASQGTFGAYNQGEFNAQRHAPKQAHATGRVNSLAPGRALRRPCI